MIQDDTVVVFDFKERCEMCGNEKLFDKFNKAVQCGLHTLIVETSLVFKEQFDAMVALLNAVMKSNPNKTLHVVLFAEPFEIKHPVNVILENIVLVIDINLNRFFNI